MFPFFYWPNLLPAYLNTVESKHILFLPYLVLLSEQKMTGQLRLLNIACAAKAKPRVITITRSAREIPLPFTLIGGAERGTRLFISSVEMGSKAEEAGLKRGDQVPPF